MPIQSDAERNPAILTCFNLPGPMLQEFHLLLVELDPIKYGKLEHHHSVSIYCTDLIDLVLLQKLRLQENAQTSCKQFASIVRIGRLSEHVALRHLPIFGSAHV